MQEMQATVRWQTHFKKIQNRKSKTVRVSSRRLLQVRETIALLIGELDWIVMKCLEKDRTRRYETANGTWRLGMEIPGALWEIQAPHLE